MRHCWRQSQPVMAARTGQADAVMERVTTSAHARAVTCRRRHGLATSRGVRSVRETAKEAGTRAAVSVMDAASTERRSRSMGISARARAANM